jgi:large subunit ribosomal protein LP0
VHLKHFKMSGAESARKQLYFSKLVQLLNEYSKIFIVGADNVGSNQMQKIRKSLRGKGVVLMGKNTMIRKAIRGHLQNNPNLETLLPFVRGNIGFVFSKDDLSAVKKVISENKVAAPAKAGAIAPCDVVVPAGNTGLEPTQTSFFQALNIGTKINKGQIEISNNVNLIKTGDRVGASEAGLLAKLNIKPFAYGLAIKNVWDNGAVYGPEVLELTDEAIVSKFNNGVKNIAALGLAIGYPTVASLPHSVIRGYKNVLAISLGTEYSIPQAEKIKNALANPGAAAPAAAAPAAKKEEAPKKEEKKESSEEDVGGFGLFGDD